MHERTQSIYTRTTPAEKKQIERTARKCGLSVSEYIRQRCLGYAPREIPPETFYRLCHDLNCAREKGCSDALLALIDEVRRELIEPGRDG